MTTTFKVPTADELRAQLVGLGRLLTARKWERAAIVFAFTEVGEVGRGRWHKPDPPKMHIREFAAQGFTGLTTNKAVSRYRDAWVSAVSQGWTQLAEPGKTVVIPDQPFPAWPYGDDDDEDGIVTVTEADDEVSYLGNHREYHARPIQTRVLANLDSASRALALLADAEWDEDLRDQLVARLTELQKQTREALKKLRNGLSAVR